MASKYGYMARIGADTSGLQAGLKDINNTLKATDNELYKVNKSIKTATQAGTDRTDLLKQKEDVLKEAISETSQKLEQLRSIEENVKNAANNGNISAENYRDYQREIANTEAQLRQYQTQLISTQQEEQNAAGANQMVVTSLADVQSAYKKVAEDIGWFTDKLKDVANGALNYSEKMVKYSLTVGQSFESSMSQVKAYSGAVGEDFDKLESAAKDAGATTSKSATEAADALGYMALAGWDTQEMLDGLMPIVRASEAGTADLKRTSDLVTDSMSAMGVATDDLAHYLDVCTAAQSNSNTTLSALLEAYVGCGGTLRNMNVPLEESAALLGTLANRGIKASEAGTSLNSILVNLMGANKSAREAMESIGVSAWDAQGKFIGVTETLRQLDGAFENCTEQEKAFLEAKIGGKTQMDTLQALIAGVREEYNDLYTTLENSQGALETTADTMHDNLAGAMTTMKSALEALGVEFYDYLEEPAREAVDAVTDAIRKLTKSVDAGELGEHLKDLSEKAGKLIEKLTEFAAEKGIPMLIDGLSDLVDVLSWVADNFDLVTGAVKTFGAVFVTLKIGQTVIDIMMLVSAITALQAAAEAGSVAAGALGVAMSAIPIVAIAAAFAGLVVGIGSYCKAAADAEAQTAQLKLTMDDNINSVLTYIDKLKDLEDELINAEAQAETNIEVADRALDTLDDLVDENGNLKDAQYNVDEQLKILNQTFGLHLEVIDGQIQGYKDLKDSYEEYCESLRENAKLEAMRPAYVEAVGNIDKLEQSLKEAEDKRFNANTWRVHAKNGYLDSDQIKSVTERDDFSVWLNENGYKANKIINQKTGEIKDWDKWLAYFDWAYNQADAGVQAAEANIANNNKIIQQYEDEIKKKFPDGNPEDKEQAPKSAKQLEEEKKAEESRRESSSGKKASEIIPQKKKERVLDDLYNLKDSYEKGDIDDDTYYQRLGEIVTANADLFRDEDADKSDFWKKYNKEWQSHQKSKAKGSGGSKDPKQEAERNASSLISKKKKDLNVQKSLAEDGEYTDADFYDDLEKFAEEKIDHDTEAYTDLMNEIKIGRKQIRDKASEEEKKKAEQSVKDQLAKKKEELQEAVDNGDKTELEMWQELEDFLNNNNWTELEKLSDEYSKAADDIGKNKKKAESKEKNEQRKKDTKAFTDEYDALAERYKEGLISEEQYQKELLDLKQKYADKDIDISEHIAEKEKEIDEKRLEDVKKKYDDLNKEIDKRADDIAKGALGSGKLYEEKDVSGGGKKKIFTDLNKKKAEIQKYTADLQKLRETGIPADLMDEILAMDYDDRKDVISELLKMTDAKRDLYYSDYTAYHAAAKEAAQLEYSDDKAAIDEELSGMADSVLAKSVDMANQYGKEAAQAYLDGYNEVMQEEGLPILHSSTGKLKTHSDSAEKQNVNVTVNMPEGKFVSGDTPIQISIAGQTVISTVLEKMLTLKGLSGRNNNKM